MNAGATTREASDRALFDRISDHYARKDLAPSTRLARRAIVRRAVRPLLEQGETLGTVLDIGCGIGAQMEYLDGRFERYVGVDHSESLIAIGRERFGDRSGVEFLAANIKDPSLPAALADTVLAVGALHHMTDLPDVMTALHRLAKPGAHFVAIEPQRGNPAIQGMRRLRMKLDRTYSPDQHFFTAAELRAVLNLVPMSDARVEFQGFLTPPFGQAGVAGQWLFRPLSAIARAAEPLAEAICVGPLGQLSWNAVAYGRFP